MNYGQLNTLQRYVEENYDFSDFVKELWESSFKSARDQLWFDINILITEINDDKLQGPIIRHPVELSEEIKGIRYIDSLQELKEKIEQIKNAPPFRSPMPPTSTHKNYEEFAGYLAGQMTEKLKDKGVIRIKDSGEILVTALPIETELGRKIIDRSDFLMVLMRVYTNLYIPMLEEYWGDIERYFDTIETLLEILRNRRVSKNKGSK